MKVPRIKVGLISFLITFLILLFLVKLPVYSQSISDLEKQINEKTEQIAEKQGILGTIEKKIAEIKGSSKSLSEKIALMTAEVNKLQASIDENQGKIEEKVKGIEDKQEQLERTKEILDVVSSKLYVESRGSVVNFFFSDWNGLVKGFHVKRNTVSALRREVEKINGEFSSLAEAKAELDKEREDLDKQKEDLDKSYALLADERTKLQAELNKQHSQKRTLSAEITDLSKNVSQLQAALIAARSAGTISSGGSTGGVLGTSISQAPAGSFGVFSIGAYTHRNGMSQWGARARADAGQSYQDILRAYYPFAVLNTAYQEPAEILVKGWGTSCYIQGYNEYGEAIYSKYYNETISFDTYMNRIFEMPASWNIEVLKAQAIAARTYAIHKVQTQGYIEPNQSNQVSKDCDNASGWLNAVAQTKNQVILSDGNVFAAEYAAVHGGWGNHVGWDTRSGTGDDWFNDSWDKISGVNWFYRSWYISGSGTSGETCEHSPFLSNSEMALILNAYFIKHDIGLKHTPDKSRLLPSDFEKCPGRLDYPNPNADPPRLPTGKIPYSLAEMQNLLSSPVTVVHSVSTVLSNGSTVEVVFNTDRGFVTIEGSKFKDIYNQMAPGHMRIQQSAHAYFNVEKR